MPENSNHQKEKKEEILVYPKEVNIPQRKKKSTLVGALLLLLISLVLLWACGIFGNGEDAPAPIPEEGVETPDKEPSENPAPAVTYLEQVKDPESDKYEFRAAWLPSVRNLDYPERPGMIVEFEVIDLMEDPRIPQKEFTAEELDHIGNLRNSLSGDDRICVNAFLKEYHDAVFEHCMQAGYARNIGGGCAHVAGRGVDTAVIEQALEKCGHPAS